MGPETTSQTEADMRTRSLQLLFLSLITAGQAAVAAPETVDEPVKLTFPENAGAESVYRALGRKSRHVCRSRAIYAHLHLAEEAKCRKEFVRDAVVALDRPSLTALHRERVGGDETMLAATTEVEPPK
jgi:hypothetical protein